MMPLLSFRKPFGALILAGAKRQTVRAPRKNLRDPKVGDRLFMYTGLRTKYAKKIGEATCTRVDRIHFAEDGAVYLNGRELVGKDRDAFAIADGFADGLELAIAFEELYGLPFDGRVFHWAKFEPA